MISEIVKAPVPQNLYYEIAMRQERTAKATEVILYDTTHLPETENLFYADQHLMDFDASILDVYQNVLQKNIPNLLILDQSAVYPTSGGQQHDNAVVQIEGIEGDFNIIDAVKVGKVVLHTLDKPLEGDFKGKKVSVKIDAARRKQL
jgi:alanyl-tRNA synthetase